MGVNSAQIQLRINADVSGNNDLGNPSFRPELEALLQFLGGTTADKVDIIFSDERSVNASSNDDIDLSGVLADAFGATIAAVEIVFIAIKNLSTSQTLTIGVAGTNPWVTMWAASGDGIKVFPRGVFMNAAPDASGLGAVVGGASDVLRVANGSGSAALYEIIIGARTA